jgi:hypothetical protein
LSLTSVRSTGPAAAKADACSLCDKAGAHAHQAPPARQRTDLLPWAVVLTAAVVVALIGEASERWFGIGAVSGLAAGIACAWASLREARRGHAAAQAASATALSEDADMRVDMVIKQFEWAVNDVAKLKRDLERAEAAADAHISRARERERYTKRLERQIFEMRERLMSVAGPDEQPLPVPEPPAPNTVPLRWGLHMHGDRAVLELELGVTKHRPSRVRIVDRDGQVIGVSTPSAVSTDGKIQFAIDGPPSDLLADLDAGRELNYAIEALADYEWKAALLEDSGNRTRLVTDKQGRFYRVNDASDAAQLLLN